MVKNYANTIRIDTAFFFENEGKNLRFQKYPDSCRQGLSDTHKKSSKAQAYRRKICMVSQNFGFY